MATLLIVSLSLLLSLFAPAARPAAQLTPGYDNPTSPVDTLSSYYNAINLQDYVRAYGYWETPPRAYDRFAAGFADTSQVQLIVQPPTWIDGAAGSVYASIPTAIVVLRRDGSTHTYTGCFVTRRSNLDPQAGIWHLYSGRLSEVADVRAIPALLAQACVA